MLTIKIPAKKLFDEETETFISTEETVLNLEHSLFSLSKWESLYKKPFLARKGDVRTPDEMRNYIRCMTLNDNVNPMVYYCLTTENIQQITEYMEDKMTATTINHVDNKPSRDIITAELIYHWMVALQIPFECQHWHLNKLLTLIEVCNIKSQPPKKMGRRQTMARNKALNAQRRRATGSKG